MEITLQLMLDSILEGLSSPVGLLFLLGAVILQILMLWSTEERFLRWSLLILSGALMLICPALAVWIKEFSIAFLAGITFPYTVILFFGVLTGTVLYKFWTMVRTR